MTHTPPPPVFTHTADRAARHGVALPLVMISVAVVTILSFAFIVSTSTSTAISQSISNHGEARYIAESGLMLAIAQMQTNPDWRNQMAHGVWAQDHDFAGGTFTIHVEDGYDENGDGDPDGDGDLADDTSDRVTVIVTANYGGTTHKVEAIVTPAASETRTILFVGKKVPLDSQDAAKKEMFEGWGYEVITLDQHASQSDYDEKMAQADVIYISERVSSGNIQDNADSMEMGVVSEESYLNDAFGLTNGNGSSANYASIDVKFTSHYITSAFAQGEMAIMVSNQSMRTHTGDLTDSAIVLATRVGDATPVMVAMEAGDELINGGTAPARRVYLPWGDNGFDINALTEDGRTILRRAIEWASQTVSPRTPVARWTLDEASGTNCQDLIGANDGTYQNAPTLGEDGAIGQAAEFDGAGQHGLVPHGEALNLTEEMTISAWVKASTWAGDPRIVQKGGADNQYRLYIDNGDVVFAIAGVGSVSASLPGAGDWVHVAGAYDGSTIRVYIDGEQESSTNASGSIPTSTDPLYLAAKNSSAGASTFFGGAIDDVRIFDYGLNAVEVKSLFELANMDDEEGEEPNLVALYEFVEDLPTPQLLGHWKLDEPAPAGVGGMYGLLIHDDLEMDGHDAVVDTYRSTQGDYSSGTATSEAVVYVNSTEDDSVELEDNAAIKGDVYVGPGSDLDDVIDDDDGNITGTKGTLDEIIPIDDIDVPYISNDENDETVSGNSTYAVDEDTRFDDLKVTGNGKLRIDGNITIVVEDDLDIQGNGSFELLGGATLDLYVGGDLTTKNDINADSKDPSRLRIYMYGFREDLKLTSHAKVYALAINPDGDLLIKDNAEFYGGYMGDDFKADSGMHIDLDSATGGPGGASAAADETTLNDGLYQGATPGAEGANDATATAASFDGSGDYIEIPHDNRYLLNAGTVSFWFRTEDRNDDSGLWSKDSTNYDTGGHLSIEVDDKRVEARLQSTSSSYYVQSNQIDSDTWYHVVFTFGPGGMRLYLNGQLQDTENYTGGLGETSGGTGNYEPIVLGASAQDSGDLEASNLHSFLEGEMDDVRIYDYPLDVGQVDNLYQGNAIGEATGPGFVVRDTSGYGSPLDLYINDTSGIAWTDGGLQISDETVIASIESATKLYNTIANTGEMSIELIFSPSNVTQDGPARIASFSEDANDRNFTVGQEDEAYAFRLRTTGTGDNGTPTIESPDVLVEDAGVHLIITYADDTVSFWRNGVLEHTEERTGDLSSWSPIYRFVVANEIGGGRPWRGSISRIAIYDQGLNKIQAENVFEGSPPGAAGPEDIEFEYVWIEMD